MKLSPIGRLAMRWLGVFIPEGPAGDALRGLLYRPFLQSCGRNFKIASRAFIYNPAQLSVGDNVYIGFNSYLGQGQIDLKDEVLIGNFVSITASNHRKKNTSYRFGGFTGAPIIIEQGAWLAAHCSITSGVHIGQGALVAAGAVVTKNVSAHSIVGGIPAKEITHD